MIGRMTEPLPTEPLLVQDRLALWAQERPLLDPDFADLIIEAVSVLLRQYGSALWTAQTIPARARDIGYIVAKDYYLNPRQLRQETVGPLQESLDNSVLGGIRMSEEYQAELAGLATDAAGQFDGIWLMGFTRGPVETDRTYRGENLLAWDERHAWPIEYLAEEDADAMTPPETVA
jgi:hypothetical protein